MMTTVLILFWLSLFCLYFIYDGYLRFLQFADHFLTERRTQQGPVDLPSVTILLTVCNEANEIAARIYNILALDYPVTKMQLLVASDGSSDGTDEIVLGIGDKCVQLYQSGARLGKTETQNRALTLATGEIIVFTDAGTRFQSDFLTKIVAPFADSKIGAVNGQLLFAQDVESGIAASQGYYWNYELCLRQLESRLGILAVVSGACVAIRKVLFRPMNPSVGEDCLLPLDVVMQGSRVVHASDAIAMDRMDRDAKGEFRARVRMTLRNWQGTWAYPYLLNPFRYPGYAFALWSHKILRWLSPFFLLTLVACASVGAILGMQSMKIALGVVGVLILAALIGWRNERGRIRIPGTGMVYSFFLANAGFLVGVIKALGGRRVTGYR